MKRHAEEELEGCRNHEAHGHALGPSEENPVSPGDRDESTSVSANLDVPFTTIREQVSQSSSDSIHLEPSSSNVIVPDVQAEEPSDATLTFQWPPADDHICYGTVRCVS